MVVEGSAAHGVEDILKEVQLIEEVIGVYPVFVGDDEEGRLDRPALCRNKNFSQPASDAANARKYVPMARSKQRASRTVYC